MIDKSHLSEESMTDWGLAMKSNFMERNRNNELFPKTKETQLATPSSKLNYLNIKGSSPWLCNKSEAT